MSKYCKTSTKKKKKSEPMKPGHVVRAKENPIWYKVIFLKCCVAGILLSRVFEQSTLRPMSQKIFLQIINGVCIYIASYPVGAQQTSQSRLVVLTHVPDHSNTYFSQWSLSWNKSKLNFMNQDWNYVPPVLNLLIAVIFIEVLKQLAWVILETLPSYFKYGWEAVSTYYHGLEIFAC